MYKARCYLDLDWAAPGMGGSGLMSLEANNPGVGPGAPGGSGVGGIAQTLRMQQAEQVYTTTAISAITQAQFNTMIDQLAADLKLEFAATNSTGQTNLAQAAGWATGAE